MGRNRLAALIPLGALCAIAAASGPATRAIQYESRLKDPQFISEGARLFAPTCGTGYCHGAGGSGGGGPKLKGRAFEPRYLFNVISNGVPGTSMIPFKSQYSEEQIWKMIAFISSDNPGAATAGPEGATQPSPTTTPSTAPAAKELDQRTAGDPKAGRALFFDSAFKYNCAACHSFKSDGASIGPELSGAGAKRSARELFLYILMPKPTVDSKYPTMILTLRSGEKITGVRKEQDEESVRVYDTTDLPAVLRTIQKTEIARIESVAETAMPRDYAARYTMKQLLDIVAFLKSDKPEGGVSLSDLLGKP
jgi:putative heme-binding domain-containing protein